MTGRIVDGRTAPGEMITAGTLPAKPKPRDGLYSDIQDANHNYLKNSLNTNQYIIEFITT